MLRRPAFSTRWCRKSFPLETLTLKGFRFSRRSRTQGRRSIHARHRTRGKGVTMPSQKPTITNPAKEKLKAHRPITRMNVFESLRPSVVKIAAMAGFDLILVDTEHVIHNDETLTNFLVLARDNGVAPVVTVIAPDRATSRLRWGYTASGSTQRSWPPWRVWCNEPWRAASPSSPLPCRPTGPRTSESWKGASASSARCGAASTTSLEKPPTTSWRSICRLDLCSAEQFL